MDTGEFRLDFVRNINWSAGIAAAGATFLVVDACDWPIHSIELDGGRLAGDLTAGERFRFRFRTMMNRSGSLRLTAFFSAAEGLKRTSSGKFPRAALEIFS